MAVTVFRFLKGIDKMKKQMGLVLVAMLFCMLLAGCSQKVDVETAVNTEQPLTLAIDANITALHMATVTPKVSGKLLTTPLTVGQNVQEGQMIVQIDPAPYEKQRQDAQAALVQSATAITAPAASAGDPVQAGKIESLYRIGAISRTEYERMMASASPAPMATASTGGGAINWQAQEMIRVAQEAIANTTIYAPLSGRVTAIGSDPSVAIANTAFLTIQQETPLVASFAVPSQYAPMIAKSKTSHTLEVVIIGASGEEQAGELTYLSTQADTVTNTMLGKVTFNNPNNAFVPGEFYRVRLSTSDLVNQLTISKTAVRTRDTGDFVYVITAGNVVDLRSVVTGGEKDGRITIVSGLKEGEKVVMNPSEKLEIGMTVTL